MAEYLRVKNWEKYQRNKAGKVTANGEPVKYIKMWTDRDSDPDYCKLTGFQRYILDGLCRLRGRFGKNPCYDADWVSRALCCIGQERHCVGRSIDVLVSRGFLILTGQQIDSPQVLLLEKRRVEESREEQEGGSAQKAAPRPSAGTPDKSGSTAADEALAFAGSHFKITKRQNQILQDAFAWADLQAEYRKMDSWLEANPTRRPKRISAFAHNWLNRERPRITGNGNQPQSAMKPEKPKTREQAWEDWLMRFKSYEHDPKMRERTIRFEMPDYPAWLQERARAYLQDQASHKGSSVASAEAQPVVAADEPAGARQSLRGVGEFPP